jgi:hypothetical protein
MYILKKIIKLKQIPSKYVFYKLDRLICFDLKHDYLNVYLK